MSQRIDSLLVQRLRGETDLSAKLAIAAEALREPSRFDGEGMEALARELKAGFRSLSLAEAERLRESLPSGPNTAYLFALLAGEEAAAAWERFFATHYTYDPFHRLAYARVLAAKARFSEAARQLQLALWQPVRHSFYSRSEKLIREVAKESSGHLRQVRVAVLGTSTTNLLIPILRALSLRDRIGIELYEGLFGSLDQEILDATSGLAAFRPEVVFLAGHWRDLALPGVVAEPDRFVEETVAGHRSRWENLSARFSCHVVQHGYDFPSEDPYGPLSRSLPGGRARVIGAINGRLAAAAPSYVSLLDVESVQRQAARNAGTMPRFGTTSNSTRALRRSLHLPRSNRLTCARRWGCRARFWSRISTIRCGRASSARTGCRESRSAPAPLPVRPISDCRSICGI